MIKKLLSVLLLILAINIGLHSQVIKQVDKISGDTTWMLKFEKLYNKVSLSAGTVGELLQGTFLKRKDANTICFSIRTGRSSVVLISPDDFAYIKLKNDTVIKLTPMSQSLSDNFRGSYGGQVTPIYQITETDIRLLKENEIKFIRIGSSIGYLEYDIKDKFTDVLQKMIKQLY